MAGKSDFLFGIRSVIEAIRSGKEIEKVLVKKGLQGELYEELIDTMKEAKIAWQTVPVERINRATRKNHQGVIAFVSAITYHDLENTLIGLFEEGKNPLVLVLDGITDIRNMGAIARSAECAGVNAIVIPEKGGAPINADAVKTSAGALLNIPVSRVKNLYKSLEYLQNSGLKLVAATEKASENYTKVDFSGPTAIVMGAEDKGVSSQILKICDAAAKIPIVGTIGSLNVSVAAGILVYEAVRQRNE
ncbi:23S rRNA (guanosine(2251)-2'-O)-methyltransferase RlmB [Saccharicrinis fermentans]|uniref:Putative TrmH family tRNA/rRNA methyltransferase n=1 Tax=Saccharicrinis fermentans DSM 9555 = JCM 21142 TaxID=869213 RepID=W7XXL5_9BACT|nr:23S rRNA (guanosine(2251)-2'-O)-methyltransferase RlmB [Saccharicrinis fermentans]GAF03185.1 putative TrmH family tRNA/rRNA methyltransferase [Saccharicrinis fermentans DSM 9555 = JCM 21142]